MMSFRPRLWPTVMSVPALFILLGLGFWQVQRLHWKEGLIAARHAAVTAAPVAVPRTPETARGMEFHHVAANGVFLNDKEILVHSASQTGEPGFHVFTPLREEDGRIVFINRGFVPVSLAKPAKRERGELTGIVRVSGLLRLPPKEKPNWFIPDNRPDKRSWFWVDLAAMARADRLSHVVRFYYIDADARPNPGGWPKGGTTRLTLPNHHLQYAITWFSLAVALVVVYVVYHLKNTKLR